MLQQQIRHHQDEIQTLQTQASQEYSMGFTHGRSCGFEKVMSMLLGCGPVANPGNPSTHEYRKPHEPCNCHEDQERCCYDPELSGTLRTTLHHQRHRVRSVLDPRDISWSTRSLTELLILQFCIGSYCVGHLPNWGACYDRGNTIIGDDRPRRTTKC
jgi:hypothetical protein